MSVQLECVSVCELLLACRVNEWTLSSARTVVGSKLDVYLDEWMDVCRLIRYYNQAKGSV